MQHEPTDQPVSADEHKVAGWQRNVVIAIDRGVLGFARRWAVILALLAGLYGGLPFVAPVAMHFGQTTIANIIYTIYSPLCHQMAFRSWFLFGEQTVYPRARAGLSGLTFEQVASADPFFKGVDVYTLNAPLIYAAKEFRGNPQIGWKVAFCERDVAIYGSIAVFGLLYALLRKLNVKVPYLPFWAYLLIAIVPIGLDGGSQMLANPPFNGFGLFFYPLRESTPFLRALTGSLFGIGNAWLAFPYLEESMQDTRELVESKLVRAGVLKPEPAQAAD